MATQHDTTLSFQVKETIYALTVKGSCFTATHSAPDNFTKLLSFTKSCRCTFSQLRSMYFMFVIWISAFGLSKEGELLFNI